MLRLPLGSIDRDTNSTPTVRDVATSPSVACKINDTALIFEQEPAPGTLVENSFDTRVTLYINCQG
jgi:hypothetical protein